MEQPSEPFVIGVDDNNNHGGRLHNDNEQEEKAADALLINEALNEDDQNNFLSLRDFRQSRWVWETPIAPPRPSSFLRGTSCCSVVGDEETMETLLLRRQLLDARTKTIILIPLCLFAAFLLFLICFIQCVVVRALARESQSQQGRSRVGPRLVGGMNKEERRAYISKELQFQTVHHTGRPSRRRSAGFGGGAGAGDDEASVAASTAGSESLSNVCAICLRSFRDRDQVCFSNNSKCHHTFHRKCIVPWLERHEECPCCRQNYLERQESEKEVMAMTSVAASEEGATALMAAAGEEGGAAGQPDEARHDWE